MVPVYTRHCRGRWRVGYSILLVFLRQEFTLTPEFVMLPRLASNSESPYLSLPSLRASRCYHLLWHLVFYLEN